MENGFQGTVINYNNVTATYILVVVGNLSFDEVYTSSSHSNNKLLITNVSEYLR